MVVHPLLLLLLLLFLARPLPTLPVLTAIQRVKLHYGDDVSDTSSLKQIFCSNIGYKGCPTPLKKVCVWEG